ncbi:hypothetical protein [Actinoplanes siamensis]|uniref:hypothetical protein n=1 Tax=Actinoplanes siamensis TaxID=1223317 RepID=UPI001945997E|nr:hypothetical protein [Actinoplanes siamensis]
MTGPREDDDRPLFPNSPPAHRFREEASPPPRPRRLIHDPAEPARPAGNPTARRPPPGRRPPAPEPAPRRSPSPGDRTSAGDRAPAPPPAPRRRREPADRSRRRPGPAGPSRRRQDSDEFVGLVAGPVVITRATVSGQAPPGLLAVAVAALITLAAAGGRALRGGAGFGVVLLGVALPLLVVTGVAVEQFRASTGKVRQFTVRTRDGRSTPFTLRDDEPRDALRANDVVRVTPGRGGTARTVAILAGMDGPVVRRLAGHPALPRSVRLGFAGAALLLAVTALLLAGAF